MLDSFLKERCWAIAPDLRQQWPWIRRVEAESGSPTRRPDKPHRWSRTKTPEDVCRSYRLKRRRPKENGSLAFENWILRNDLWIRCVKLIEKLCLVRYRTMKKCIKSWKFHIWGSENGEQTDKHHHFPNPARIRVSWRDEIVFETKMAVTQKCTSKLAWYTCILIMVWPECVAKMQPLNRALYKVHQGWSWAVKVSTTDEVNK